MELVSDFLHREIGRLEPVFDFENNGPIDEDFHRFVCRIAYDGSEVTGRYAEFVGIECNAAFLGAMLFDERDESAEQFALTGRNLGVPMLPELRREALHLVVGFQKKVLQPIADDDVAE